MHQPELAIRVATPADLDALMPLNAQVQAIHVAARPDFFRTPPEAEARRWLAGMLADPCVTAWLAFHGSRAVGYALAIFKQRLENPYCHPRTTCEIQQVCVAASARKTGVARALIESAIAHAADEGVEQIELNVWAFNGDARAAFERLGFAPRSLTLEHVKE